MKTIDKNKPVLVTGATGYVAGWIVKRLLEQGITVHAAVRNPDNKKKIAHLDALAEQSQGSIRYFKADLLDSGSFADAMQGCELVMHTASPFTLEVEDPQRQLIDPAVDGTANVLTQANATSSVKRVVVTSSCAAIYTDCVDTHLRPEGINESDWNTTASLDYQPYSLSKTLAEQKAWEIAKAQDRWDLVTVNPSFVMGPALNPDTVTSETFTFLQRLGDGTLKMGVPKLGFGVVDVRDVAEAHLKAAFTPEAHGRYITSAHNTDMLEMAQVLYEKFGASYPLPKNALPKWLLMLIGPMVDKSLTRRFIKNNVNEPWRADNSKIKKELGMQFKPLKTSMEDGFQMMVDAGKFNK